MPMPAWSHSSLTAFETCPFRYYMTRVSKQIIEPPTEATIWGNQVHKALELRLKGDAPLPVSMSSYEPLVQKILSKPGKRLVERRFAITANFAPTKWQAKNAWCRGIVDVGVLGTKSAFLGDWKTGKRKADSDQMKLMALLAFAHYPYLESAHSAFIWLKDNKLDPKVFTSEQRGELWGDFLIRVKRLERAYELDKATVVKDGDYSTKNNPWIQKPSGLCGDWCPVTKKHCPYGKGD